MIMITKATTCMQCSLQCISKSQPKCPLLRENSLSTMSWENSPSSPPFLSILWFYFIFFIDLPLSALILNVQLLSVCLSLHSQNSALERQIVVCLISQSVPGVWDLSLINNYGLTGFIVSLLLRHTEMLSSPVLWLCLADKETDLSLVNGLTRVRTQAFLWDITQQKRVIMNALLSG